jgi:hypothetical protein
MHVLCTKEEVQKEQLRPWGKERACAIMMSRTHYKRDPINQPNTAFFCKQLWNLFV